MGKIIKTIRFRTICCFVLIALFLPIFSVPVFATGRTVKIKDLGIECTIPDSFTYVFTRDNISDADASALGMTKNEIKNLLTESNAYLEAGTEFFESDLRITMVPITIGDFSDYGDTLLDGLASEMVDSLKAYGYSNITWEIYHHPDTVFLKMEYSVPSDTGYSYSIQYYTVMNAQAINFTCSFRSKPTSADKTMVKGIVDSAVFENAPAKESDDTIKINNPASDFSDVFLSFRIPAGWKKETTSPSHTLIKAKYTRVGQTDVLVMYGTKDIWSELSAEEKKELSRTDFSNSSFTTADAQELFVGEVLGAGNTVEKVTSTKIDGKDYFQILYTMHNDSYGIPLDVKCTMMVHIEEGYASLFIFTQAPTGAFFNEFKTILESVDYHYPIEEQIAEPSKESVTTESNQNTIDSKSVNSSKNYLLLLLLIIPAATGAIFIIKKHKTRQKPLSRGHEQEAESPPVQAGASQPAILFCHKCGNRLAVGDTVCRQCGATIPSR